MKLYAFLAKNHFSGIITSNAYHAVLLIHIAFNAITINNAQNVLAIITFLLKMGNVNLAL